MNAERYYEIGIGARDAGQVYNRETEDRVMERFLEGSAGRRAEVDELIAHGWGTTDADKIPANWREVDGPEIKRKVGPVASLSPEQRAIRERIMERERKRRAWDRERKRKERMGLQNT